MEQGAVAVWVAGSSRPSWLQGPHQLHQSRDGGRRVGATGLLVQATHRGTLRLVGLGRLPVGQGGLGFPKRVGRRLGGDCSQRQPIGAVAEVGLLGREPGAPGHRDGDDGEEGEVSHPRDDNCRQAWCKPTAIPPAQIPTTRLRVDHPSKATLAIAPMAMQANGIR